MSKPINSSSSATEKEFYPSVKDLSKSIHKIKVEPTREKHNTKEMSFKKLVRLVYRNFAERTSSHGFSWTVGPSSIQNNIAILLVIIALISLSMAILKSTSEYLFQISYQTRFDMVEDDSQLISMPDFIICHSSPWSIEKAKNLNISIELLSYITVALNPYDAILDLLPDRKELYERLDNDYVQLIQKSFDGNLQSLLDAVTVNCSDFLRICKMGAFDTWKECCGNVFNLKGIYSFDGKCFTTKGVMNHNFIVSSSFDAVQVLMVMDRIDPYEHLNGSIAIWSASALRGVTFALIETNDDPLVALFNSQFISYGVMTRTKMKKTIVNRGGINCFNNVGTNYSQKNCKMRKFLQKVQTSLSCTPIGLPLSHSGPLKFKYCSPYESIHFSNKSKEFKKDFMSIYDDESEDCKNECNHISHESTISTQLLQNNYYREKQNNPSMELLLHTMYFPNFHFPKITQVPKGIVDWLGDLGGNCGFYLGASIFSIIEFFYFLFKIITLCIVYLFGCSVAKTQRVMNEEHIREQSHA